MAATGTQPWTTGPALVYANGMGLSNGSAFFVGTCREKPIIDVDFEYEPVRNDLAGAKPADMMYLGRSAQVTCDLTEFNYPVVQALCSPPNFSLAIAALTVPTVGQAGQFGWDNPGDLGTLMITEQNAFVLYVVFPYFASHPAMAGMVPGYRFLAAMTNKESIVGAGTETHTKRLIFDCERVLDKTVVISGFAGRWTLYDFAIAGLPVNN